MSYHERNLKIEEEYYATVTKKMFPMLHFNKKISPTSKLLPINFKNKLT